MQTIDLDTELAALAAMTGRELRERWTKLTAKPAPKASPALLRLALAWELQARVYGGLSATTEQRLARAAAQHQPRGKPAPRQRLVREWRGALHTVTIDADETIRWNGKTWRSLSEVARAITGTRWSGPAFFGLKQKGKAA